MSYITCMDFLRLKTKRVCTYMYTLLTWQIYLAVPIIFRERQLGGVFTTMYRYSSKAISM